MKRLATWVIILAILGGLGWWQRAAVVPFVVQHVPPSQQLFAAVPGLAEYARPQRGEAAEAGAGAAQGGGGRRRGGGGPVTVVLAKAETKNLPVTLDAVGTAQSSASVAIRTRVDSQVMTVEVAEGAKVQQGDRLFTLDDRQTKAQIDQIQAQIVKDQAQIAQAQTDLERANDLFKRNAGNAVTRDTAATAVKVAQAQLVADQASLEAMKTTLTYTVITAPVSGRIGSIPVKPGAIVKTSDSAPLATVNRIDPSLVSFALPQKNLTDLREAMAKGPVGVEVLSGRRTLPGTVQFIENTIDVATGTITVKATVPNAEEVLWPGAYVTVDVILDKGQPGTAVPSAAVQLGQQGPYVFVVKDGQSAELRQVTVARNAGEDVVISEGLKAGEDVVVDGQLRLVDGAKVNVKQPNATVETPAGILAVRG